MNFFKSLPKVPWKRENSENDSKDQRRVFQLSPRTLTDPKDIKRIQPYLDYLKSGLDNPDITNIALTGIYGSGKSTILKTFESLNKKKGRKGYNFLNISLASFKDATIPSGSTTGHGENKETDENSPVSRLQQLEQELEISILQQIFYKVKPTKIPESRFKRIISPNPKKLALWSTGFIIWLFSCFKAFYSNLFEKIDPSTWDVNSKPDWSSLTILSVFVIGILTIVYKSFLFFQNSSITKLSIRGEISLGEKTKKSVFNQYLEEILYFFERTEYDVVVFEDIDRFRNCIDIFSKLREINILLNASDLIDRPINFVYAVKDDLFRDKSQRVKFFDLVIPVIPFIDPNNADEQLQQLLKEAGIEGDLSPEFVDDVVTFIDDIDMRLLINVVHEYLVYHDNLPSESLNKDELFAIIVYKNLFPDDYALLHNRQGKLYRVLTSKKEYSNHLTVALKANAQDIEEEIQSIEDEVATSTRQLRAIYLTELFSRFPSTTFIRLDNSNDDYTFYELLEERVFEELMVCKNIKYRQHNKDGYGRFSGIQGPMNSGVSFKDLEQSVGATRSYYERERVIKDKLSKKETDLKLELESLKASVSEIEKWTIKQLFTEIGNSSYLDGFKNTPLIQNLIRNGNLNENYTYYTSIFHEVKLSKEDFTFLRNVKSNVPTAFDESLKQVANLINKLRNSDFERPAILNISFLDYLLDNRKKYKEKLDLFLKTIVKMEEASLNFVDQYTENGRLEGLFMHEICRVHPFFWSILLSSNYSRRKLEKYLLLMLSHVSISDLLMQNDDKKLTEFINEIPHFLEITRNIPEDRLTELLDELMIKFIEINPPESSLISRLKIIYENWHYLFTRNNVTLMINSFNTNELKNEFELYSYSSILSSNCEHLVEHSRKRINEFVDNVLVDAEELKEDEKAFLELINTDSLNSETKISLIAIWKGKLSMAQEIQEIEILGNFFSNNKVIANWNNITEYYSRLESEVLDKVLVDFLNNDENYQVLPDIDEEEFTSDFISDLFLSIIASSEIQLDPFKKIVARFPDFAVLTSLNITTLDQQKIQYLIETKRMDFSEETLLALRKYYEDQLAIYFEINANSLLELTDSYATDELIIILGNENIAGQIKVDLLKELPQEWLNKWLTESKKAAILVGSILSESKALDLPFSTLNYLVKEQHRPDVKITIIGKYMDDLSNDELQTLIEPLGYKYKELFIKRRQPIFKNTTEHIKIFDELERRSMIIRYEPYKKDGSKVKVFANYK